MPDTSDVISRLLGQRTLPRQRPKSRAQLYQDMLQGEGIYSAQRAGLAAEDAAQRSSTQAAIDALRFQYNDPTNPYSTVAQRARQLPGLIGNLRANRAARGVLYSGGTALQEADIGYQRGLGEYNDSNALMSGIGGLEADYASGVRQRFGQQQGFLGDAQQRLLESGLAPQPVVPKIPKMPIAPRAATPSLGGVPYGIRARFARQGRGF